ncbi:MAG: acyl-CoA thioesterase [Flavobacteriales bacterium]|nr:acyl-CoA thioesterase [Flavobacteriales bacterium]
MYKSTTQIRVRYSETDQMGYCYYGNYAAYFEVARVDSLRQLGLSYKAMEDSGIALPVLEYQIKYFKPAFYDDLITIETTIEELPKARIHFLYKSYNSKNELINEAKTTLVFVNKISAKPCIAPEYFIKSLEKYFK